MVPTCRVVWRVGGCRMVFLDFFLHRSCPGSTTVFAWLVTPRIRRPHTQASKVAAPVAHALHTAHPNSPCPTPPLGALLPAHRLPPNPACSRLFTRAPACTWLPHQVAAPVDRIHTHMSISHWPYRCTMPACDIQHICWALTWCHARFATHSWCWQEPGVFCFHRVEDRTWFQLVWC